jgi:hypothetical protein
MAKCSDLCGTRNVTPRIFTSFYKYGPYSDALLGDQELPGRVERKLSRLEITGTAFLLVSQWDILPGKGAPELGREDQDMQNM